MIQNFFRRELVGGLLSQYLGYFGLPHPHRIQRTRAGVVWCIWKGGDVEIEATWKDGFLSDGCEYDIRGVAERIPISDNHLHARIQVLGKWPF